MFSFYLRNAVGKADLIFQAMTKNNQACKIELADNYLEVQSGDLENKYLKNRRFR